MLLSIRNLFKTYHPGKTDVKALRDINLDIDAGEFTAICGPSGSGKTTLLNLIGCIDRPDGGEILLDGQAMSGKTGDQLAMLRREYFGFIFQTYNLIPVLTAYENVELALSMLGKPDPETKRRVNETLEKVGLGGLGDRMPLELSGGQQQRVSIARALVKKPKLILADEPTANLDSKTGAEIVDLMRLMNEKEGVTFIFSTHDQLVMKHARRLVEVHDGQIKA